MTILQYLINLFISLHQPQGIVSHDRTWEAEVDLKIDPKDVYSHLNYSKMIYPAYSNIVDYITYLDKIIVCFVSELLCNKNVISDRVYNVKLNQFFQNTQGSIVDPNIVFSRFLFLTQELDILVTNLQEKDNEYLTSKNLDVLLRWSKPVLNNACIICSNFIDTFHEQPSHNKW